MHLARIAPLAVSLSLGASLAPAFAAAQLVPPAANSLVYAWQWWISPGQTGARFDSYLCQPTNGPIAGSCGNPSIAVNTMASATPGGVLRARASVGLNGFKATFVDPAAANALVDPPKR
jgi:hypothetical protein